MSQIIVLAGAEWDLEDWQDFFEARQTGLGEKFILAFRLGVERIAQFPRRYAKHWRNVRVCPLRPFHIGVFYRVETEAAYLLRVLDLRSKPGLLRRQLGM